MHADGTVHFSDLKKFAQSPAHYRHSVECPRETSRPMRIGSLVDMALLTELQPLVYEGDRRGKAWADFRLAHLGQEIYTRAELEDAETIITAARRDPLAREYLGLDNPERRTQVPLRWTVDGVPRSTRGVDVLIGNKLVDLKVTNSTQPGRFVWHARRSLWHCQLADYAEACAQNGIDVSGGLFLVGIESSAPYPVTVLRMTPGALEAGRRCLASWMEMYRACADAGQWPGYAQSPVDLDVEMFDLSVGDGDEEDSTP